MELRETLRVKMCEHMEAERRLRKQIQTIDNKEKAIEINKLIGQAFRTEYGYMRIERFDFKGGHYYGTEITRFGKGKYSIMSVELNHTIYNPNEEKNVKIRPSVFKSKLNDFLVEARKHL